MQEERKAIREPQTRVELQVLPCASKAGYEFRKGESKNHESQDDLINGKIILTVTCDGSKLTKADAGYIEEYQEEVWASVKLTKADAGRMPDVVVDIHEKCGAKLTKADAGKLA